MSENLYSHIFFPVYIAIFLKLYVKDDSDNTNNFTKSSKYKRNVSIEGEVILVTFNSTYLYTNIPIADTLNIINDYVNNNYHLTRKMGVPLHGKFYGLVNLVLTTSWYTFSSTFFQKIISDAMGEPAPSTTAEIYILAPKQSIALHLKKFGNVLLMTFNLFLNART